MGLKRYVASRVATLFGVLMVTLLLTIALVGSNMDIILKQGVAVQVREEIAHTPGLAASFESVEDFEAYVSDTIQRRILELGLDEPWYSPQRLGLSMYKILVLDFGYATFLTSDSGSAAVGDIIAEKLPRTILLFTTATVIISLIGIFLGALSGSKVGSVVDRITSSFAVVSSSFPVWWVGMLLIVLFAFAWEIFPARATPTIPADDPGYVGALLYHMTLPLITIVLIGFGAWAYLVRNFMVGVLQDDFIFAKKTMGNTPPARHIQACPQERGAPHSHHTGPEPLGVAGRRHHHRGRLRLARHGAALLRGHHRDGSAGNNRRHVCANGILPDQHIHGGHTVRVL